MPRINHTIDGKDDDIIPGLIHLIDHHKDRVYTKDRKIKFRFNHDCIDIWETKKNEKHPNDEKTLLATVRRDMCGRDFYFMISSLAKPDSKSEKLLVERTKKDYFHKSEIKTSNLLAWPSLVSLYIVMYRREK
jgi:hypothetical protein